MSATMRQRELSPGEAPRRLPGVSSATVLDLVVCFLKTYFSMFCVLFCRNVLFNNESGDDKLLSSVL